MKAVVYEEFSAPITLETVPDPDCPPDGVVIQVMATGVCRSDWHGWQGHDSDIKTLPHVPGHELAGTIAAVGSEVRNWRQGDRVTVPFVSGCGRCGQCVSGNHQVCDRQYQPGFHGWGSFAQYVALPYADVNLVRLANDMSFAEAASLGCRFVTSFRGVVAQAKVRGGEWVVVYGCGGVGLSAIMIADALGANIIAVDIDDDKLALAQSLGALEAVNAGDVEDVPSAVRDLSRGGAHVSIDALGSAKTCRDAILSLRKRGRHVQIGLLAGDQANPPLPMGPVIGWELEIYGSHGMAAHAYPEMLDMIAAGKLQPARLIGERITLEDAPAALMDMDSFPGTGITVIDRL